MYAGLPVNLSVILPVLMYLGAHGHTLATCDLVLVLATELLGTLALGLVGAYEEGVLLALLPHTFLLLGRVAALGLEGAGAPFHTRLQLFGVAFAFLAAALALARFLVPLGALLAHASPLGLAERFVFLGTFADDAALLLQGPAQRPGLAAPDTLVRSLGPLLAGLAALERFPASDLAGRLARLRLAQA